MIYIKKKCFNRGITLLYNIVFKRVTVIGVLILNSVPIVYYYMYLYEKMIQRRDGICQPISLRSTYLSIFQDMFFSY